MPAKKRRCLSSTASSKPSTALGQRPCCGMIGVYALAPPGRRWPTRRPVFRLNAKYSGIPSRAKRATLSSKSFFTSPPIVISSAKSRPRFSSETIQLIRSWSSASSTAMRSGANIGSPG